LIIKSVVIPCFVKNRVYVHTKENKRNVPLSHENLKKGYKVDSCEHMLIMLILVIHLNYVLWDVKKLSYEYTKCVFVILEIAFKIFIVFSIKVR